MSLQEEIYVVKQDWEQQQWHFVYDTQIYGIGNKYINIKVVMK